MKILSKYKKKNNLSSLKHRFISSLINPELDHPTQKQDPVWLSNLLQRCAKQRALTQGKSCHAQIISLGIQTDTLTSNILINMYSKCNSVNSARQVFDQMPKRTLVSWNTLIATYTQNGNVSESLNLFIQLLRTGLNFSEFTFSSVICACAAKLAVLECKQLHAFALKALISQNVYVGTALLDVYAKCTLIKDAFYVFENMSEKSDVTYSSMLSGLVQNELYEEALILFRKSKSNDQFIISSALSACASLASSIEGKQIHTLVEKYGFNNNIYIASTLIDMYSKSGMIKEAYFIFSNIEEKNIVLWNSILSGFSKHAKSLQVMILFEKLQQMGFLPNDVTYMTVLSACGHMGLVEKGKKYFNMMLKEHNLAPNVLHYSCMVDILGRAGFIKDAYKLFDEMPFKPSVSMWGSLLASCRVYKNVEIGEIAAQELFKLEPNNGGNYVLLSNIYASNKKWYEVAYSRKVLKESDAKKEKGKSWVEVKDTCHSFMVGEINHPRIKEIYLKLNELVKEMRRSGYKGVSEHDLHDVDEREKLELLKYHSEKLALVYGLMCLPNGIVIRIMKNLRICGDCHLFMKFASKLTGREIVVRDVNRFHHFKDGFCSCGEFW